MPVQQETTLLCIGGLGVTVGVALAVYSSIRGARIWRYVAEHRLAPDLVRWNYLRRFVFSSVCAAYENATGDRASVRTTYLTGVAGLVLFFAGIILVAT